MSRSLALLSRVLFTGGRRVVVSSSNDPGMQSAPLRSRSVCQS